MATLNRDPKSRGQFHIYHTYAFRAKEQDPVIDTMRTIMDDEFGAKKKGAFTEIHVRTGLSQTTLGNWFVSCKTQKPQYASIAAFARGMGYDIALVKTANKANGKDWRATGPAILNRR